MLFRVFIRKPTVDDCQELLSLHQKSKEFHFPWTFPPLTEQACTDYINRCQNEGLHRVEANIQPENVASINLVTRLGFTKEGFSRRYLKINEQWRDHERWALTMEDWEIAIPQTF